MDRDALECYHCGGFVKSAVRSSEMYCCSQCEKDDAEIHRLEARVQELMLELERVRQ